MFLPMAGGCPRKWALKYLAKIPIIPGQALKDGVYVHKCIEDYLTLTEDEWLDLYPADYVDARNREQRLAALSVAMVRHSPALPGARVEPSWMHVDPRLPDTEFYIKPDLTLLGWFVDWKTTSADSPTSPIVLHTPEQYCGHPPDTLFAYGEEMPVRMLRDDVQANLYALAMPGDSNWAAWVYGCKKFQPGERPNVWTVEHRFHADEVDAFFERVILPAARVMNRLRVAWEEKSLDSPLLVPHYSKACSEVGKFCDSMAYCFDGLKPRESPVKLAQLRLPS